MQSPARQISFATTLLVVIASGVLLYLLQSILLPLCVAALFSVVYRPLVAKLRQWKVPMVVCILLVVMITGAALFGMYAIIDTGIAGAIEKAPQYEQTIDKLSVSLNSSLKKFSWQVMGDRSAFRAETILSKDTVKNVATYLLSFSLSLVSSSFLVLLFLLFMIPAAQVFPAKLQAAFAGFTTVDVIQVYNTVNEKVLRYLTIKTVLNLLVGLATWLVLVIYGVDFALLIALLTFLLHFIPNVGSIFSAGIPFLVSVAQFGDIGTSLLVVGTLVVVHNVLGNVVEPRVLGDSLDLSPVLVLFSLAFWGWMWGPIGMILSVPITAIIKTVLEAVPSTQPFAILMSAKSYTQPKSPGNSSGNGPHPPSMSDTQIDNADPGVIIP